MPKYYQGDNRSQEFRDMSLCLGVGSSSRNSSVDKLEGDLVMDSVWGGRLTPYLGRVPSRP
jgi:hypothetical protein